MKVAKSASLATEAKELSRMDRAAALLKEPQVPVYPAGVTFPEKSRWDSVAEQNLSYLSPTGVYPGATGFLGFPFLAELWQIAEYRAVATRMAQELTRKFVRLVSRGEVDKSDRIKQLNVAMERFKIRAMFRQAAELGGGFGRGQLYIDLGAVKDAELATPLATDTVKIKKGSFKGLRLVEPMWSYAVNYNADEPLSPSFYRPEQWYVMKRAVHESRLLTFIPHPVPDLLKPVYAFCGMSMSQLAMPTIENFLKMRRSVSGIVSNYSLRGVKTNMEAVLAGSADATGDLLARVGMYAAMAENEGFMVLDKDMEDFFQHSTPLSQLDKLLEQARDNMCAVANIPRMVLFGLSPEGMNASADGELKVFDQYVAGMQEVLFRANFQKTLEILMLSELGEIDADITFEFVPLRELDEKELSQVRSQNSQATNIYHAIGAVTSDEVRAQLARDPSSGWSNLDIVPQAAPVPRLAPNATGAQPNLVKKGA